MFVIVMGVSGSGKSTIGRLLAERLGSPFYDGDDYPPPANLAKMAAGRTRAVINLAETPTSEFTHNPDWQFPEQRMRSAIREALGIDPRAAERTGADFIDAQALATTLLVRDRVRFTGQLPPADVPAPGVDVPGAEPGQGASFAEAGDDPCTPSGAACT